MGACKHENLGGDEVKALLWVLAWASGGPTLWASESLFQCFPMQRVLTFVAPANAVGHTALLLSILEALLLLW